MIRLQYRQHTSASNKKIVALVGVVTNKQPFIQTLHLFTVLKVVGDNTNNGGKVFTCAVVIAVMAFALVGVVTNKPPFIQTLHLFTALKVVGDNTNNGGNIGFGGNF